MMAPLFETHGLKFRNFITYPDLIFQPETVTFLTGPSGCGKSTLLHLMNGTLSPSAGHILYQGKQIEELDALALRREVLLVRQNAYLFDATVQDNFAEYHRYRGTPPPDHAARRMLLDLCLADFSETKNCSTLSGGEKQRVYLALCLSFSPSVLLLDEPTSALDTETGLLLMQQSISYCEAHHITPIVVSHDQDIVRSCAGTVLEIGGRGSL